MTPTPAAESRPVLVAVHGTRFSAAQWHPQRRLWERDFEIRAVDLPGHGQRRGGRWTLDAAVDAVVAALPTPPTPAVVVGHSLGGYVAAAAAQRHHDRMSGLVLMGCSWRPRGSAATAYLAAARVMATIPESWLTRWNDRLLRHLWAPEVVEPTIAAGYGWSALLPAWRSVASADVLPDLDRIPTAVLLLNGERDRIFRRDETWLLARLQQASRWTIPDAGHLAGFDQPTRVADAVMEFARSNNCFRGSRH